MSAHRLSPIANVVIDSNCLRSDRLSAFLSNKKHKAVLIDYASIEAYKKNPVSTSAQSMDILCNHPKQVLVLRSTSTNAIIDSRCASVPSKMVWKKYTQTFPQHALSLRMMALGDPGMAQWATGLGNQAQSRMLRHGTFTPDNMTKVCDSFTDSELRTIKGKGPLGKILSFKILQIAALGAGARSDNDVFDAEYSIRDILNHFGVRLCLSDILLVVRWIKNGMRPDINPDKAINSEIDAIFAAYGTMFNGLMTNDGGANTLHMDLRRMLSEIATGHEVDINLPTIFPC